MDASANPAEAALEGLIDALHARGRLRVWSLIVTIFGDAVAPRGGRVGLSVLQDLMGRLRIEPGAVRTALSRLAADGWVTREKDGRNSIYGLAAKGKAEVERASARIYAAGPPVWDGSWMVALALPDGAGNGRLVDAGKALAEAGFAQVGTAAWIRPNVAGRGEAMPYPPGIMVVEGRSGFRQPVSNLWPLGPIAAAYRSLIDDFARLAAARDAGAKLEPLSALAARILVNHDWRRIVLRDPGLPAAVLPADWPGEEARATVRRLYADLDPPSEAWLDDAGLPGNKGVSDRFTALPRPGQSSR